MGSARDVWLLAILAVSVFSVPRTPLSSKLIGGHRRVPLLRLRLVSNRAIQDDDIDEKMFRGIKKDDIILTNFDTNEYLEEEKKILRERKDDIKELPKATRKNKKVLSKRSRPERKSLKVPVDYRKCSGCGTLFQTSKLDSPGYILPKLFMRLEKEYMEGKSSSKLICQRCHDLTRKSTVSESLTTQWGSHESLSPERFAEVVSVVRDKQCVVVFIVDLFDFQGTFLDNLDEIVGSNPVLLAANKVDLLPKSANTAQTIRWIRREIVRRKIKANVHQVNLISSISGSSVENIFNDALELASTPEGRKDIYVIGAANVGKSSFVNRLIQISSRRRERQEESGNDVNLDELSALEDMSLDLDDYLDNSEPVESAELDEDIMDAAEVARAQRRMKKRKNKNGAGISTSRLPGTTLDLIRIEIDDQSSIYDTPGIIMPTQLTHQLLPREMEAVVPSKRISYQSVELKQGKALLIGGLAKVEMLSGKPFFATVYMSKSIQIHPTRADNVENFISQHAGSLISPPFTKERFEELRPFTDHNFRLRGIGFKHASADIVISGLGWLSFTGSGPCELKVSAPDGVAVFMRDPLMQHFAMKNMVKFTGKRFTK